MELDAVKISGFLVLFIGVAALLFTFYNAFTLLTGFEDILGSQDLSIFLVKRLRL